MISDTEAAPRNRLTYQGFRVPGANIKCLLPPYLKILLRSFTKFLAQAITRAYFVSPIWVTYLANPTRAVFHVQNRLLKSLYFILFFLFPRGYWSQSVPVLPCYLHVCSGAPAGRGRREKGAGSA